MKKQNGITLIALVITIVVLLILAAVSINAILGDNGILNRATQSKTATNKAVVAEYVQNAVNAVVTDGLVEKTPETIDAWLIANSANTDGSKVFGVELSKQCNTTGSILGAKFSTKKYYGTFASAVDGYNCWTSSDGKVEVYESTENADYQSFITTNFTTPGT